MFTIVSILRVTFFSLSRVKGLLEAAGAQILCLRLGAEFLPVSQDVGYPVWQQQRRALGFKGRRKWSRDGER